jgi:serine protease AprX
MECIVKPDIIAPGCGIISTLSNSLEMSEARRDKLRVIEGHYVRMSGTSMASPCIAGACALLLSKYPNMTPDEVKLRLKQCAMDLKFSPNRQGWGMLDLDRFVDVI